MDDRRGVVGRGWSRLVSLLVREKRLTVKIGQVEEQVKELMQKVKERRIVVEQNQRVQTEDHPTSDHQLHPTQCVLYQKGKLTVNGLIFALALAASASFSAAALFSSTSFAYASFLLLALKALTQPCFL